MRSIRKHLIRSLLSTMVALLLVGGFIAYRFVHASFVSDFDSALTTKGRALATLVEFEHGGVGFEYAHELMPEFERPTDPDYFQIWTSLGEVVARSASLQDAALARRTPSSEVEIFDLELPDGRSGRAMVIRFMPRLGEDAVDLSGPELDAVPRVDVMIAVSRVPLDARSLWLLRGIVLMEAGLLIAILFIVRSTVAAGLAPLDRLASDVSKIDAEHLDRRVSAADQPVELAGISERLNELIERLESAFHRERRFTSAAAHELRTPIAELRALAEVSSKWAEACTDENHHRAIADVKEISYQMENLVQSLLTIARNNEQEVILANSAIELEAAVEAALAPYAHLARAKEIHVAIDVSENLCVRTNRECLLLILQNLLSNAVEYSPPRSTIDVAARSEDRGIVVRIANENSNLVEADLARLFEPFWRKDEARTASGHSGLGLAVVDTLARALGVTVVAHLNAPRMLTIELVLARADPISVKRTSLNSSSVN